MARRQRDGTAFYCIADEHNAVLVDLLRKACAKRRIRFLAIDPASFDFRKAPALDGQMLYRTSTSTHARMVERFLLLRGAVATVYRDAATGFAKPDNVIEATMIHEAAGIPIPKTVYGLAAPEHLGQAADTVGGFPLILKAAGGAHGIGVMKIDSLVSLRSVADFLRKLAPDMAFVLREFIDVRSSARCIVLGGRVVDSIEYRAPKGDFRSNIGTEPSVHKRHFSAEIEDIAVRATNLLGWEFGGVDLLIDRRGRAVVTEVNTPCYFARCQLLTGTDTAGMLVEFLRHKALTIRAVR